MPSFSNSSFLRNPKLPASSSEFQFGVRAVCVSLDRATHHSFLFRAASLSSPFFLPSLLSHQLFSNPCRGQSEGEPPLALKPALKILRAPAFFPTRTQRTREGREQSMQSPFGQGHESAPTISALAPSLPSPPQSTSSCYPSPRLSLNKQFSARRIFPGLLPPPPQI